MTFYGQWWQQVVFIVHPLIIFIYRQYQIIDFALVFFFFSGCLTFSVQTLSHIFFFSFFDFFQTWSSLSVCWGKRKNCVIGWMRPWLPAAFIYGNSIETAVFLFLLTVVTHMPNLNRSQAPKLLFIRRSMLTLFIIQPFWSVLTITFYSFLREAGHQPDRFFCYCRKLISCLAELHLTATG